MRDRLIELIKPFKESPQKTCAKPNEPTCYGCKYDVEGECDIVARLADHLLAEGVIVPPCKVGQTVYEAQPIRARTQAYKITTVKWNGHYWWFTWVVKDRNGIYGNVDGFSSHQIGKSVFLTREKAEKALAEREGKG